MEAKHVEGENRGHIMLYALSTCVWCKKTKRLLNDLGVEYYYIDVDLLEGDEKAEVIEVIKKHNPRTSFPTIVINKEKSITGFKENEIKEALGK
jgi:glutaredoxin-like protein NrdH